ncbi:ubiquitin-like protein Pup [Granulicoccus phenolivorans]|uniref:ubiquitin-like protein Pup n=1 Tax=Granulicoccus phenolivorans TaxID=266854 RepID=UPI00041E00BF|nr:ubiquitin-like protein Pup [Granulicoccus phenolivorans]
MSESAQQLPHRSEEDAEQVIDQTRPAAGDEDLDDLLDEIDDVLEVNAEQFVRSFVQKGGQ